MMLVTQLTMAPGVVYVCSGCGAGVQCCAQAAADIRAGKGPRVSALWAELPVRSLVGVAPAFSGQVRFLCGECHRGQMGRGPG